MSREQLIEKAAAIISGGYPGVGKVVARDVVDALLPQVTTVEELEELPVYTILVRFSVPIVDWLPNPMGHPVVISGGYRRYLHSGSATTAEELLAGGPLTVVWQP